MEQNIIFVSQTVHFLDDLFNKSSSEQLDFEEINNKTEVLLDKIGLPKAFYTNVNRALSLIANIQNNETPIEQGVAKLSQCYKKLSQAVDSFIIKKYPDTPALNDVETDPSSINQSNEIDPLAAALNAASVETVEGDIKQINIDKVPDDLRDLLMIFISTQQAKLEELEEIILNFENGDTEALSSLLRELHTLKGELGVLGLQGFADLIHSVEEQINQGEMKGDNLFRLKDLLAMKFNELSIGEDATITDDERKMILSDNSVDTVETVNDTTGAVIENKDDDENGAESDAASQCTTICKEFDTTVNTFDESSSDLQDVFKPHLKKLRNASLFKNCKALGDIFTLMESFLQEGQLQFESIKRLNTLLNRHIESIKNGLDIHLAENDINIVLLLDEPSEPKSETSEKNTTQSENEPLNIAADPSFLEDFVTESREHLTAIENTLLDLESDPENDDHLNLIFRGCHTIKGIAGFLELKDIQELAHNIENLMDHARQKTLKLDPPKIDVLLESIDLLAEFIEIVAGFIGSGEYRVPTKFQSIMMRLDQSLKGDLVDATPERVEVKASNEETQEQAPDQVEKAEVSQPVTVVKKPGVIDETVRVPIGRLDQLIDAIGEAVIAQSMISADPVMNTSKVDIQQIDILAMQKKVAHVDQVMRQIQELSMSLRMVSIKPTFQKMARLIRDFSKKTGKNIQFSMEGEDTELDKSVVENIADPLMHMIRNSVDHGIESPEERAKSGKTEPPRVILRAYQAAGNINIDIEDNGGGLKVAAIKKKGIDRGLINENDTYSDSDIQQLIFHPGFSTADTITDISGRGVGMDVVRRNIEQSRGSIETRSEEGVGTKFIIRLPLTLAIIDGMIVTAAQERYIVPTLSIIDSLRPNKDQLTTVVGKGELIKVRGETITLVRLSDFFNNHVENEDLTQGIVMIVEDMLGKKIGLFVNDILGQQQVVIKTLGEGIGEVVGISGGAIMSDGKVSMILDVGAIVQSIAS